MKKKNKIEEVSEHRVTYSTKDGQDVGHWEATSADLALSCQISALKNRSAKEPQIISVESFNRFTKKWKSHTSRLLDKINSFNTGK